jgi:Recombination endonuclease VII
VATYWTCQRTVAGRRCGTRNPGRKQNCLKCGGKKRKRRVAKHMTALEAPYEVYVTLNDGDRCGICLRPRSQKDRKFDRDHDHRTGRPRGLLCHKCNRALPNWITPEWLRAAAEYLERADGG